MALIGIDPRAARVLNLQNSLKPPPGLSAYEQKALSVALANARPQAGSNAAAQELQQRISMGDPLAIKKQEEAIVNAVSNAIPNASPQAQQLAIAQALSQNTPFGGGVQQQPTGPNPVIAPNPGVFSSMPVPAEPVPVQASPVAPKSPTPEDALNKFISQFPQQLPIPGDSSFDVLRQNELGNALTLGNRQSDQIKNYRNTYISEADDFKKRLSQSLLDIGNQQFQLANPYILQDLNARGLASSPTAVAQGQSNALKEIALANQENLLGLDLDIFNRGQDISAEALNASLGGEQGAIQSINELNRAKLQSELDAQVASREQNAAERLAKQQQKNDLIGSLIGAGGNILGSSLLKGAIGKGGAAAGGASGVGGLGLLGGAAGLLGGGYLGQGIGKSIYGSDNNRRGVNIGSALGAGAGTAFFGPVGGLAGGALGGVLGGAVSSVGKKISKIFCFDPETEIEMSDGSERKIKELDLGQETKGGWVESIRKAITGHGTKFNYLGVVVTGAHAVFEDGKWKRVEDANYSIPIEGDGVVYSVITSNHRVYSKGITFADEVEHDDQSLTYDQNLSLEKLNEKVAA